MKRTTSVFLVALLVAVLLVPAAAMAKGGDNAGRGHGRSAAPGQVGKAGTDAQKSDTKGLAEDAEAPEGEDAVETDTDGSSAGARKGKGFGKAKQKQTRSREASGAADADGAAEASGAARRTGVENALDRIRANIAKAEAKVEAGTKKHVPPGLLRVLEKFLGWLGLAPVVTEPAPDEADDGSKETSITPEPGSDEDSGTVIPEEGEEPVATP